MHCPKAKSLVLKVAVVGAVTLAGWQAGAESNRVRFPADLEKLVHYTTVTRGNVTEHMLTSREAIREAKDGQPLPDGTQVILADYRDGKIYRYFVMEKGEGWGAGYDERQRTADWQFQWYWPDGSINMNENTARCRSCHQSQAGKQQYMFTFTDMAKAP
jgi:lipoprotein-anchoring transpeptidase ErfK/SrfK